jgi:predicted dehydrogenase/threonine dehydrogenase-like Zn-dependent dehydrogenase
MKQVLQSLRNGVTEVVEVPSPGAGRGRLLIRTTRTLVSVGTERMLVEFGKAGLIGKARQQPDKVRQVFDKVRTDGIAATLDSVRNKLDQPVPLGYSNVGVVVEVGAGVTGFSVGDRVASNGYHAELVSVPVNLCARIPDEVSDDEASFMVLGAIALQGIRLAQPTLGECVVVTGLGLIGLVAVQLLRANGCRVLGLDYDPQRLAAAREYGAETVDLRAGHDPVAAAETFSRGRGVDAVLITAATQSNEPMHQAALMCRQRGRIVLIGVTGLELSRDDFFKKELTFQVSASYGPGRYDPRYEDKGLDYPIGFVRWTENRNFEAVLDMLRDGRLAVKRLVTHRFRIDEAERAYELISGSEPSLGVLLEYPGTVQPSARVVRVAQARAGADAAKARVAFIGAGNFATAALIPAFAEAGAQLTTVVSAGGVSGLHAARKFGFAQTSTDSEGAFADPGTNAVVVTTRHDSHARMVIRALEAGKHVFVEKPLCLTNTQLDEITATYDRVSALGHAPIVTVGFNRRFAPHVVRMKSLLSGTPGPKAFVVTVNAGAIPANHWTQDLEVGGGRIVGEACHFVDLLRFLAAAPIVEHHLASMTSATNDTVTIQLKFADGSLGTVHYFANGSKRFPKERVEAFSGNRVLQLDNFRRLTGYGWPGFSTMRLWRQDKGHRACALAFVRAVESGSAAPIPFNEIIEVSRVVIALAGG